MIKTAMIVNASSVLRDDEITSKIPAFQKAYDRDFMPAWANDNAVEMRLDFMSRTEFNRGGLARAGDVWPFFLNRHSIDDGVLGWHTEEGSKVYGRVFVGDCIRYGIDWGTDLMHEIFETGADPAANRAYRMQDGRIASIEVCDAVEADALAYEVDGVKISNFVFPAYFGIKAGLRYDYGSALTSFCPALTPGGYMSIYAKGVWGQIQADRTDGLLGRRALMSGWRRLARKRTGPPVHIIEAMAA
jgi:hypothetical protein